MIPLVDVKPASSAPRQSVLGSALMRSGAGLAAKVRWHLNHHLVKRPWLLNAFGARLSVVDAYGAPGDTLLTAIVVRHLRRRFPRLRLNVVTPNPDLLRDDPNVSTLNEPETFFSVWSWYPDLAGRRDGSTNVLRETFARLGLQRDRYDYASRVYLRDDEHARGRELLGPATRPIVTFHTRSNEPVKDWPLDRWRDLIDRLRGSYDVIHLGDAREPVLDGVRRFAGQLSLRESMSVLAHARVHLGADSFLMHAANGLGIPSVIIFGGSRTPANVGYAGNVNLFTPMPCGPCWIHAVNGEQCGYGLACMEAISVDDVASAVRAAAAARNGS
ncbi:unnamed protein product [uncultured bacterium]|nr:unnamed protein product [uncultured bacterium]